MLNRHERRRRAAESRDADTLRQIGLLAARQPGAQNVQVEWFRYGAPGEVLVEWDDGEESFAVVGQPAVVRNTLRPTAVAAPGPREVARVERAVARAGRTVGP